MAYVPASARQVDFSTSAARREWQRRAFLPLLHDNKKQMRVVTLGLAAAGGKCGVCAAGCEKSNAVIPPGGTICYRVLFAGLFLFLDYWGM